MTIVQIVPLRRLPAHHRWFDYVWNLTQEPRIGQLVTVPFGSTEVRGIIWGIVKHTPNQKLKSVQALLVADPILTLWQQRVLAHVAKVGYVSLSTALLPVLPKSLKMGIATEAGSSEAMREIPSSRPRTWWYQSRMEALYQLRDWMVPTAGEWKLLIVPTIEDGQDLMRLGAEKGTSLPFVHGQMTGPAFREIYRQVLHGQVRNIIGTVRALSLPFPHQPQIIIDQEEHPAHRQLQRQPRIDAKTLLQSMHVPFDVTTPAPSLWWWDEHHPSAPTHEKTREIGNMGEPKLQPWISSGLEELVERARVEGNHVTAIVPRQGFAHGLRCQDCHTAISCQFCGEFLRLFQRPEGQLICSHCRRLMTIPTSCPHCHGSRLAFHGLGPERFAGILRARWPQAKVVLEPSAEYDILVQTYKIYHWLLGAGRSHLAIVSGDSLLNYPDFAAAERAWQFLWRLSAAQPSSTLLVQTFSPAHDFWQRWVHGDDRAFYQQERNARRRFHLPPMTPQWIARYAGPEREKNVGEKIEQLRALNLNGERVSAHVSDGKKAAEKIIISQLANTAERASESDWLKLFPPPWQLEGNVQSWSD
ncbi:MAG: hypothetical protein HY092_00310 [Candidatus Kerfeldbacteria bacterium]|nr:hypothetical protein [Candidatus Kerfeldbacteria bacterium]